MSSQEISTSSLATMSSNNISKFATGIIPLLITIFYMYSDTISYKNILLGILLIFFIAYLLFLCGCKPNTNKKTSLILIGSLLFYALLASMISVSIKKSSKFKYFWANLIAQYSIYINLLILLSLNS